MSNAHTSNKAKLVSDEELEFFEEAMAFANPTPEENAAFADYLRTHGSGIGDDANGRLVRRNADGFLLSSSKGLFNFAARSRVEIVRAWAIAIDTPPYFSSDVSEANPPKQAASARDPGTPRV